MRNVRTMSKVELIQWKSEIEDKMAALEVDEESNQDYRNARELSRGLRELREQYAAIMAELELRKKMRS
jgi:hypothetical protein